ncbi:MAG: hypothetical protein IPO40_12480 [Fibrobacteres bacterium]|nr:hypothetical protein [Fibrobacterota bacterium]
MLFRDPSVVAFREGWKMTSARRFGWSLATALLVASCDAGRTAGGTVETENVSEFVVSVDSIAPLARYSGGHPVVATVRMDSTHFDFDHTASDGRDLVVEKMDGTPIPFAIHRWEAKERWARIQVRLDGDLLRRGARFRLRSDLSSRKRSDSAAVWRWIPEVWRVEWTSVLVDDFERGVTRTRLPIDSAWYTIKVDSARITNPVLVAAGGGRTGTALRFDYHAPPPWPVYVLMGTTLAHHPVNFGSLDSIVFWAKGNGVLSVSLDHPQEGRGSKTWMHNTLDSTWKRWRVRPQDFDPPGSGGNLGWAIVHDSVTTLSFFASGSGMVMLDDIRFFGMSQDDFR